MMQRTRELHLNGATISNASILCTMLGVNNNFYIGTGFALVLILPLTKRKTHEISDCDYQAIQA